MAIDYSRLPGHMQAGARRYVERGIPPGHFMTAVICNDLFEAVGRADDTNKHALADWARFFYNEAPRGCFGSPEHFQEWIKHGGLEGQQAA